MDTPLVTTDPRRFFPAAQFGDVREFAPITMGLSGAAVYSVTTSTGDFILRIQPADRKAWDRTVARQRLAAEHGVAPPLVYVDEDACAAVSVKVPGGPFGMTTAQPDVRAAAFRSLVDRLATLHAIPPAGMVATDLVTAARRIWDEQILRPGFPPWAVPLGERIAATSAALADDPRQVFSHCDLNPANLLWDGRQVWLIDWEMAGLAHPYLDLAILANFLMLPEAAALGLLAGQQRAPIDTREQGKFAALRDLARIVYGGIFFRLIPDLLAVPPVSREQAPTLARCYELMARGELVLSEPRGQALVGAALLKQCEPTGSAAV